MSDDLDRAVIRLAEDWAQECDQSRLIPTPRLLPLYDAVKARQRALRPSRVDVIREVIAGTDLFTVSDAVPIAIEEALTKWEQE